MKKFILTLVSMFFVCSATFAGTAAVFENSELNSIKKNLKDLSEQRILPMKRSLNLSTASL